MTLQSSGAISMSQIKDEFGGSGSHALSEYYALAGLGVSGIPASGAISFSQFHGKSNQVTTSVWVTSGYNSSSWVYKGQAYASSGYPWVRRYSSTKHKYYTLQGTWIRYTSTSHLQWQNGNYKYQRGDWVSSYRYKLMWWHYDTVWVDTSAYQNTTTTAQIST
jgi:hypothetical protein